jgi:hypothetical protein
MALADFAEGYVFGLCMFAVGDDIRAFFRRRLDRSDLSQQQRTELRDEVSTFYTTHLAAITASSGAFQWDPAKWDHERHAGHQLARVRNRSLAAFGPEFGASAAQMTTDAIALGTLRLTLNAQNKIVITRGT